MSGRGAEALSLLFAAVLAVDFGVAVDFVLVVGLVRSDCDGVVFVDPAGEISCLFESVAFDAAAFDAAAFEDSDGLSVGLDDVVFAGGFAGGSCPSIAATEGRFHPNQALRRGCMTK